MSNTSRPKGQRFPILLVEDDIAVSDILKRAASICFPEADFTPISTFQEAVLYLYSIEGNGPKLILLDIFLSGTQTGLDFLTLLKAHPLGKLVPVIVLSASDNERLIKETYQLGAASYFMKPFTFQDWKGLLTKLRLYWLETITLPQTYFEKINNTV